MSSVEQIKEFVRSEFPRGKPFSTMSLCHLASVDNARQILHRMVKEGELTRVSRGVFVRPKKVPYIGETLPDVQDVVDLIASNSGETIAIHGAEAVRQLKLSTQVPLQPIFYTTGNTRHIKMGNISIKLQHISPRKLVEPGTIVGTVLSALWYLGKHQVTAETIRTIESRLTKKQFQAVFKQIERMPAWMTEAFYCYKQENDHER